MLVSDIVRRNAEFFSDNEAIVVPEGATQTWAELDARTNRFANALLGLGLSKGDRIAIFSPNCGEFLEFFFATAKSGIIGVATNIRLSAYELSSYLSYAEPTAILVHASLAEDARAWLSAVPSIRHVIGFGSDHGLDLDLEKLIGSAAADDPEVSIDEDDVYQLGATSGTTGIPKAAVLTHRNTIAALHNWLSELPIPERGTALQCIPMFFNPGGPSGLHPVMMKGGRTVIPSAFDPTDFPRLVQEYQVTNTTVVPTMVQMIISQPGVEDYDFSSLRGIMSGGSPYVGGVLKRAREIVGDVFYPLYGMAESYSCGTVLRPENQFTEGTEQQLSWLASIGKPLTMIKLRVVDPNGDDVPHDGKTSGEIWLAGASISPGYFHMEEETRKSREGEWFKTGDVAVIDSTGFITIVDRLKDMIITGGINVFSIEVERVLQDHPEVSQVAVIGIPHDTWGEAIHAVVRRQPDSALSEEELIEFAAERLSGYKKPRTVQFVDELPISATGKILKKELRKQYAQDPQNTGG